MVLSLILKENRQAGAASDHVNKDLKGVEVLVCNRSAKAR